MDTITRNHPEVRNSTKAIHPSCTSLVTTTTEATTKSESDDTAVPSPHGGQYDVVEMSISSSGSYSSSNPDTDRRDPIDDAITKENDDTDLLTDVSNNATNNNTIYPHYYCSADDQSDTTYRIRNTTNNAAVTESQQHAVQQQQPLDDGHPTKSYEKYQVKRQQYAQPKSEKSLTNSTNNYDSRGSRNNGDNKREELVPLMDHSSNRKRTEHSRNSSRTNANPTNSSSSSYRNYQKMISYQNDTYNNQSNTGTDTDRSNTLKGDLGLVYGSTHNNDKRTKKNVGCSTIFISTTTIFMCICSLFFYFIMMGLTNHHNRNFNKKNEENKKLQKSNPMSSYQTKKSTIRSDRLKLTKLNHHFNATDMIYHNEIASRYFTDDGQLYMIPDYDTILPFSNFLPALAGFYGKPLYSFYVNRGQCMASFGIESKDYPMQEFHSANIAYQSTPHTGFRTFIQGKRSPVVINDDSTNDTTNNYKNHWMQRLYDRWKRLVGQEKMKQIDDKESSSSFFIEPFSVTTSRLLDTNDMLFETYHNTDLPKTTKNANSDNELLPKRNMYVGSNELKIQEIDIRYQIETNVTYFTLPEEDFGAFVRRVSITNLDSDTILSLSLFDGLVQMQPSGGRLNSFLKNMGRTLQGWMNVYQVYNDTIHMPYYKLTTQPTDDASVVIQEAGHWCLSVLERSHNKLNDLLPIIYDPDVIFGDDTTYSRPINLYKTSIHDIIYYMKQYGMAKTPSAFAGIDNIILQPGESLTFSTYFGQAEHLLDVPVIARRLLQPGFGMYKMTRVREIANQITSSVSTYTNNILYNRHIEQVYLDNSLRGGVPILLGEVDDDARMRNADEDPRLKVYHVFSRIHGDLERDYNDFVIKSTFFSDGPGNYRDIVQNRRSDVLFNPRIGSFNVKMFLSFIQADGYEPLTVEAVAFTMKDKEDCERVATRAVGEADGHRAQREALTQMLNDGPFRPGQIFLLMEQQNIELMISRQEFVDMVAASSTYAPVATYSTGYWADHWTYYVDLIESYLSIYPDWEQRIMFDEKLPYFFSPAFVNPRDQKYVLSVTYDGKGKHVRQLNATVQTDYDKMNEIKRIQNVTGWYETECNWQHDQNGEVFTSSPMAKLFLLATIKFATRDAYGMGIEYEGGRPGWNDANNGLVGMLGSGMPETYELVVLMRYILSATRRYHHEMTIPEELYDLIQNIQNALADLALEYPNVDDVLDLAVPLPLLNYWDTVATARELYREKTKISFTGVTKVIHFGELQNILELWLNELDLGIARAMKIGTHGENDDGMYGITPTYFSYYVTKWEETGFLNVNGHAFVRAKGFEVGLFPLFLEGPTRMLKTVKKSKHLSGRTSDANQVYELVRQSPLRDKMLQMYTISASLKGQSFDMGREIGFAPGWLENQSVWLHMSYKFYLELLRHRLYDQFYSEMISGGMLPFMDPSVYGRSLMECSSFIASSAFDDPKMHGRGFLARLSGSTAEYLSMWVLMMIGPQPFRLNPNNGELQFQLMPALPRWLFQLPSNPSNAESIGGNAQPPMPIQSSNTSSPSVAFKLFSAIDVTYYHNRGEEDLFDVQPSRYEILFQDGTIFQVDGPIITGELADKVRRVVFIAAIDAYFEY